VTSSIERAMQRSRSLARGASPATREVTAAPELARESQPSSGDRRIELDFVALRRQGYLVPENANRELLEQYRMVKRPLIGHAFSGETIGTNPANIIQVTSSVEGEGKTFTSFNLAMSIAMELDFTVLLVDADLTRRSLSHLLRLDGEPGLVDVLTANETDIGKVLYSTGVPRLRVVPAGSHHERSTELIASAAMRDVVDELATRYPDRIILLDSTPLLMDSHALTLAAHVGQVLIVVESGQTRERLVEQSLQLIDQSTTRVGLLLNKSVRGYGYGYYGGY